MTDSVSCSPSYEFHIMDFMSWASCEPDTRTDDRAARVYLAARFARQAELREVAAELRAAGVEVTSRWLGSERALRSEDLDAHGRAAQLAQMDFEDLTSANVCIAFTEDSRAPTGRGGRHTELGIALALGMRVILVGPREHVFHCLPSVEHYPDWEAARVGLARCPDVGVAARPLEDRLGELSVLG